jgi:hypothetical protein
MKLRVARGAVRDLDAIWAHIGAEKNIETGERVVTSITCRILIPCQESERRPEPVGTP